MGQRGFFVGLLTASILLFKTTLYILFAIVTLWLVGVLWHPMASAIGLPFKSIAQLHNGPSPTDLSRFSNPSDVFIELPNTADNAANERFCTAAYYSGTTPLYEWRPLGSRRPGELQYFPPNLSQSTGHSGALVGENTEWRIDGRLYLIDQFDDDSIFIRTRVCPARPPYNQ